MGQVTLRGLRKNFGAVEVIRGVDLEVRDGERANDLRPAPRRALWDQLTRNEWAGHARRIGLRPEHLQANDSSEGVPARVELAEHLGDVSILHLRVNGLADLLAAKVAAGRTHLDAGTRVGLVPDAAWALPFGDDERLLS